MDRRVILLGFLCLPLSLASCSKGEVYANASYVAEGHLTSFRPGSIWKDEAGEFIQAHGGQIQRMPVPIEGQGKVEKYVWIGENKENGSRGDPARMYYSDDLYNWKCGGDVLKSVDSREALDDDPYFVALYGELSKEKKDHVYEVLGKEAVIERPKMLYNAKNDNYVLWFHSDGKTALHDFAYDAGMSGVAVSESPFGPFKLIDRYRLNHCPADQFDAFPQSKGEARDMNLFLDDDGKAYVVYTSENNKTIYISRLNEDFTYLDVEPTLAVHKKDFIRLFPSSMREAPALAKIEGRYYLITSSTTGWDSNVASCWSSDSLFGEWQIDGNPFVGEGSTFAFDTQSTCLFEAQSGTWIYYGDRWNRNDIKDSRYVWLPAKVSQNKLSVTWKSEWTY